MRLVVLPLFINRMFDTVSVLFSVWEWKDPIDSPQLPIQVVVKGVHTNPDGMHRPFHHVYDYFDYRPTILDHTVFEVS